MFSCESLWRLAFLLRVPKSCIHMIEGSVWETRTDLDFSTNYLARAIFKQNQFQAFRLQKYLRDGLIAIIMCNCQASIVSRCFQRWSLVIFVILEDRMSDRRGWDFRTSSTSSEARTETIRNPNLKKSENPAKITRCIRRVQQSIAVANMKPYETCFWLNEVVFCLTVDQCFLGSGRIDEEVENLYSTWELLSAEAGLQHVSTCFSVQDLPKLVRVRYELFSRQAAYSDPSFARDAPLTSLRLEFTTHKKQTWYFIQGILTNLYRSPCQCP